MWFCKREEKRVLKHDWKELRLSRDGILRFLNKCARVGKPTEDLDELLLILMK